MELIMIFSVFIGLFIWGISGDKKQRRHNPSSSTFSNEADDLNQLRQIKQFEFYRDLGKK